MEINLIPAGAQPLGVVAKEDLVEGRFVLMTSHSNDEDFGSLTDLPGVKYPADATEASQARYIVTWTAPDRVVTAGNPMYQETPSYPFALRGGWDQASNLPMVGVTVRLTWPGNQESVTIPEGYKALVLSHGAVVTVPSGVYVYNASIETPGARLEVLNTADDTTDEGKLAFNAAGTIAEVVRFNDGDASLTVRIIA